jgi:hypothetical protein
MPLRLGAVLMFALLSGCGFDSMRLSGAYTANDAPSGTFFEERGEADRTPSAPEPTEVGFE